MRLEELTGHQVAFAPLLDAAQTIDHSVKIESTRASRKRGLPSFLDLKQDHKRLALASGGGSIRRFLEELRGFDHVMACGSVHDYLIEQDIVPEYCVILDSDNAGLVRPYRGVKYLVAASCDAAVFDSLPRARTWLWHSFGDVPADELNGEPAVGGGCTVTLRALAIAVIIGYSDLHFFGLDSCYMDGAEHAYPHGEGRPTPFVVDYNGRKFTVNAPLLKQAQEFRAICQDHRDEFTPTVYGDGLVAAMRP